MSPRTLLSTLALLILACPLAAQLGDISMDGTYRVFVRYAYVGDMDKAEQKAREVLGEGYRGTEYECWVHAKLADGYETKGDRRRAIAAWQDAYRTAPPASGTQVKAAKKLRELGGTIPGGVVTSKPQARPTRTPPRQDLRASASPTSTSGMNSAFRSSFQPTGSSASSTPSSWQPAGSARRYEPTHSAPAPTSTSAVPSGRLAAEPTFLSAQSDLRVGTYQSVRAAIKKLESLVLDRGYQGSTDETVLQERIADAYLELARQHYRWAADAAREGQTRRGAEAKSQEVERLQVRVDAKR